MTRTSEEIKNEIEALETRLAGLKAKARQWGDLYNEGGEGYQDYDVRYEIPEIEQALSALREEAALVERFPAAAAVCEARDRWNTEISALGITKVGHSVVRDVEAKLGVTMLQLVAAKKYYGIN